MTLSSAPFWESANWASYSANTVLAGSNGTHPGERGVRAGWSVPGRLFGD